MESVSFSTQTECKDNGEILSVSEDVGDTDASPEYEDNLNKENKEASPPKQDRNGYSVEDEANEKSEKELAESKETAKTFEVGSHKEFKESENLTTKTCMYLAGKLREVRAGNQNCSTLIWFLMIWFLMNQLLINRC